MFSQFTEKGIRVIMLAQEESRRLRHNFLSTELILLGLIGEGTGIGAKTLKTMGVNLKDARHEVEQLIGRGSDRVAVDIPFTDDAKELLGRAWDEAQQLDHKFVGTEHLLLGLIGSDGSGIKDGDHAITVLKSLGVEPMKARAHILRLLGETSTTTRQ